jgi:hypothetical protein
MADYKRTISSDKHLTCIRHIGKEMAGSIHTLTCCLSKLRSSLEAGKKQLIVWLQYVCGVTEMFLDEPSGRAERLYPSFGAPLVFLWSPHGDSEMARNGFLDEPSGKAEREDCLKWSTSGNTCSLTNEAGFGSPRTYVQGAMNLCNLF